MNRSQEPGNKKWAAQPFPCAVHPTATGGILISKMDKGIIPFSMIIILYMKSLIYGINITKPSIVR